jgi:pimeloyl-ACP methyl ester carboxylesterase
VLQTLPALYSLTMSTIYRSAEAQRAIHELYATARQRLAFATHSRHVATRFGTTHVLWGGANAGTTPIVVFGGGNVVGPLTLDWFGPLARRFRLVAPDTIGQPGLSAGERVSDVSLGVWALDVLDCLELDGVNLVGVSYGAGVSVRLAELAPERIRAAALVVPAAIVAPPIGTMLRLALAYVRYRARPSRTVVAGATELLGRQAKNEGLLRRSIELSFSGTRLETRLPRLARRQDLARLHARVTVVAAQDDPMYPPHRVLPAARRLFTNVETIVLADSGHLLTADAAAEMCRRLEHSFA